MTCRMSRSTKRTLTKFFVLLTFGTLTFLVLMRGKSVESLQKIYEKSSNLDRLQVYNMCKIKGSDHEVYNNNRRFFLDTSCHRK